MRIIGAVLICGVVLCSIDAYWFGGMYFEAIRAIADQIRHHFF